MSLTQRTIWSTLWNLVSNVGKTLVLFVRSIILARLLPVEIFGIYGYATAIMGVAVVLLSFGMSHAFLHRTTETENEEAAAAALFTLKLLFTAVWTTLLIVGAFLLSDGPEQIALIVLTLTTALLQITETPRMILVRRVVHRRLALLELLAPLLATLVTLALAWRGATLWALLAMDLVNAVVLFVGLFLWRPVWRPRLSWQPETNRYYLRFGGRISIVAFLSALLDQADDLWTRGYLGEAALGFYGRAYAFARYPKFIVSMPISPVALGLYAELKEDRKRLSQAFFRINAFILRAGFLLAGILALTAPELIRILIGPKWMPMLDAFRLMLVFTMLDPVRKTVGHLFTAVGQPGLMVRMYGVQVLVLLPLLWLLGSRYGITGVALAVNVMLVIGMTLLFWQARRYVDLSIWNLFAAPTVALGAGLWLGREAIEFLPLELRSDWNTAATKIGVFVVAYALLLLVLEYRRLRELIHWGRRQFRR